ncbi:hypothetical protein [Stenotrophomonas sp. NLF4-10]|uniref:hypothetical protein n=1 Tax=Stenotrophomonas sp. NLF4-10 TaxID=2918754 RepID=UPI001EFC132C|nr:hypothetical protein [Stenotrophomonas sp. NLF4-10]MCG8275367.1 hypothetical protein [Stenotrophomonas sp. NLF4-10]
MSDLMQQARELLAAAYDEIGESRCAEWTRSGRHKHRAAILAIAAALRAAPEWLAIDYAPHAERVLVRCESGSVYAAHWVQNPVTGDEAWLVCETEDGAQMLVHPSEWMPIPAAARQQEASDAR